MNNLNYRDRKRIKNLFIDGFSISEIAIMYNITNLRVQVTLNQVKI